MVVNMSRIRKDLRFLMLQYVGRLPSQHARNWIYRWVYKLRMGTGSVIYNSCEIRDPHRIIIGDQTSIGDHCILDGRGGLTIGNSVNLSTGAWVWTMEHEVNSPDFCSAAAPVMIHDYAWLSCRTIILPGITIGKGAVIAAGAVVTKSVDPFAIMAGVPAKRIGERSHNLSYKLESCIHFW